MPRTMTKAQKERAAQYRAEVRAAWTNKRMRHDRYSVYKAAEGGPGAKMLLEDLRWSGILAERCHSPYIGQEGIIVFGGERIQNRAHRIIYGK